jgi:hypothetical protein
VLIFLKKRDGFTERRLHMFAGERQSVRDLCG